MIRLSIAWFFIIFLSLLAWKDWYKSLCGLILFMAFIEHPDIPKNISGIQGLNPWNILMAVILLARFFNSPQKNILSEIPINIRTFLFFYLIIIIVAFFRMIFDIEGINEFLILRGFLPTSSLNLISDHLINVIKWIIPGILLFDGCKTKKQFIMACLSILGIYFFLAIQTIKWVPIHYAISGDSLSTRSASILVKEIGYHRVALSAMLAGASWAFFSLFPTCKTVFQKAFVIFAGLITLFAQALTAGRTGYGAWFLIGIFYGAIKWRKLLLCVPIVVIILFLSIPGISDRFTKGMKDSTPYYESNSVNMIEVTSGRTFAWPYVLEKIHGSPLFGYGKLAMMRTGISSVLWINFKEEFPHPHNAYLELLLDTGIVGFIPIILFYYLIVKHGLFLFKQNVHDHPEFTAIGGICLSLVLSQLITSIGSQHFYPSEDTVGMWCSIWLMLKLYTLKIKNKNLL